MAVVPLNSVLPLNPFLRHLKSLLVLGLSQLDPLFTPAVAKFDGYALANY